MPSEGKNSHFHWEGEIKKEMRPIHEKKIVQCKSIKKKKKQSKPHLEYQNITYICIDQ
jgi:hypothetical protein